MTSSVLDKLDEAREELKTLAPVSQMLSTTKSPVLAEIDGIIRLQLLYPFANVTQLGKLAQRPARWISTVISTAAYKSLYDARRKELDLICDLPTIAEEIEAAARLGVQRLAEKIETTDDGYLIKQGTEVLLKARGQGGFAAPPAPTVNVLVDARQAAILEVRDKAMEQAASEGPYPDGLGRAVTDVQESRQPDEALAISSLPDPASAGRALQEEIDAIPAVRRSVLDSLDKPAARPAAAPPSPAMIASLEAELLGLPGGRLGG